MSLTTHKTRHRNPWKFLNGTYRFLLDREFDDHSFELSVSLDGSVGYFLGDGRELLQKIW